MGVDIHGTFSDVCSAEGASICVYLYVCVKLGFWELRPTVSPAEAQQQIMNKIKKGREKHWGVLQRDWEFNSLK